jgi:hypothetical protein
LQQMVSVAELEAGMIGRADLHLAHHGVTHCNLRVARAPEPSYCF